MNINRISVAAQYTASILSRLKLRVGFMCKCLLESAVGAQRPVALFYSHFNKEWIRSSIPVRAPGPPHSNSVATT